MIKSYYVFLFLPISLWIFNIDICHISLTINPFQSLSYICYIYCIYYVAFYHYCVHLCLKIYTWIYSTTTKIMKSTLPQLHYFIYEFHLNFFQWMFLTGENLKLDLGLITSCIWFLCPLLVCNCVFVFHHLQTIFLHLAPHLVFLMARFRAYTSDSNTRSSVCPQCIVSRDPWLFVPVLALLTLSTWLMVSARFLHYKIII